MWNDRLVKSLGVILVLAFIMLFLRKLLARKKTQKGLMRNKTLDAQK